MDNDYDYDFDFEEYPEFPTYSPYHTADLNNKGTEGEQNNGDLQENVDPENEESIPEVEGPANRLCEDELLIIFRNLEISTRDLLNFRLVNKSWRDAATRTLLRRDACFVALAVKRRYTFWEDPYSDDNDNPQGEDESNDNFWHGTRLTICKYEDDEALTSTFNTLPQLTWLISNSAKFPTSCFHIHSSSPLTSSITHFSDFPDLLKFFGLHGDIVKTLALHGELSEENLLDIFFTHAPNLNCLDLSEATILPSINEDLTPKWASKVVPLNTLIVGKCFDVERKPNLRVIHLLLTSHAGSNCSSINNVKLSTLPLIIQEGKGHLIRSFAYSTFSSNMGAVPDSVSLMKQLSATNPKLSDLTIHLENCHLYSGLHSETLPSFNALIESSKDTLKNLSVTINPEDRNTKLGIPPMRNLESVTLSATMTSFVPQSNQIQETNRPFFLFQDDVPANEYFPSLGKVILKRLDLKLEEILLRFFKLKSKGEDANLAKDSLSRVKTLEIHESVWSNICHLKLIPGIFANVQSLKINWFWESIEDCGSVMWVLCPLVEFIEIYDISMDAMRGNNTAAVVDSFFTGFSPKICKKLRDTEPSKLMDKLDELELLRLDPSVCHLQHLRELKLRFFPRSATEFASHVTGIHAFAKMPSTQFLICYDPRLYHDQRQGQCRYEVNGDCGAEKLCFESIKPYVRIVHEHEKRRLNKYSL